MYRYNRKDGKIVLVDEFTRNYVSCSDVSRGKEKLDSQPRIFNNYNSYNAYINQIDTLSTVYYNVTYSCNLHCPYCYAPKNKNYISLENNRLFLNKLVKLNTQNIVLIGGEPMMHPYLDKLIDDIYKAGIHSISIITNGTILKKEVLEKIIEYKIDIQVSVDGHTEELNSPTRGKGSLKKVLSNLKILQDNSVNYAVMQVLTKETIKFSKEFSDYFSNMGIAHGFFLVKQATDKERPTLKSIVNLYDFLLKKYGEVQKVFDCAKSSDQMQFDKTGFPITHCGAGITMLSIDPLGNVYPCVKLHHSSFLITNLLKENSGDEILMNRKRVITEELVDNLDKCQSCNIKYICGVACRAEEYYQSIHRENKYSQCDLQKTNLEYFMEHTNV